MKTVLEYKIELTEATGHVLMPQDAKVVTAAILDGQDITLWVIAQSRLPNKPFYWELVKTGAQIPAFYSYIATVILPEGTTYHLFMEV